MTTPSGDELNYRYAVSLIGWMALGSAGCMSPPRAQPAPASAPTFLPASPPPATAQPTAQSTPSVAPAEVAPPALVTVALRARPLRVGAVVKEEGSVGGVTTTRATTRILTVSPDRFEQESRFELYRIARSATRVEKRTFRCKVSTRSRVTMTEAVVSQSPSEASDKTTHAQVAAWCRGSHLTAWGALPSREVRVGDRLTLQDGLMADRLRANLTPPATKSTIKSAEFIVESAELRSGRPTATFTFRIVIASANATRDELIAGSVTVDAQTMFTLELRQRVSGGHYVVPIETGRKAELSEPGTGSQ